MRHVVIHSLAEARSALAEGGAVTLESPPGAARLQGIGWWRELLRLLAEEGFTFESVLDCADAPGHALAALADGIPCVRVAAAPEVMVKLRAIAEQCGGRVVTSSGH